MSNTTPLSPFENEIQAVLRSPIGAPAGSPIDASDASTAFILELKDRLHQQAQHTLPVTSGRTRPFMFQRGWAAAVIVLMLLMVTILAIGPQRVLAAVRSLFGYIPGVGVVQEGASLRILAEPASAEREGITLQVTEGAADDLHTVVIYQADGLSLEAANSQGEGAMTGGWAILSLPDGSILTQSGGEMKGWGTGYQTRLVFPALPKGVGEFTLLIERLESMPSGAAPENWQIPLKFEPAPANFEMLPVYELGGSTENSVAQETVAPPSDIADEETPYGIQLVLDRVVETENGFLLQGHTSWEGQVYTSVSFDAWSENVVTLLDAQGNAIPFEETQPDYSLGPLSETSQLWAMETNSKAYPGPWTMTVNSMQVYQTVMDPAATFSIDLGSDPQVGQTWQIDQSIQAAGFNLRVVSVGLRSDDRSGSPILDIVMENDPAVMGLGLEDALNQPKEGQAAGAGSGPGSGGPQELLAGQQVNSIPYFEMPSGTHSIAVTSISYRLNASWQTSWTPPAAAVETAATVPADTVCLTSEIWQQLSSQPGTLPDGLSGRLLMEQNTGALMPQLSLINLDGTDPKELVIGGWGSLSPDGSTVVYIESDGPSLMLIDTTTLQSRPIPGSVTEDYSAKWSPDGQWLAFVRTNGGLYISRPDGSGMRQVADASKIRFLVGWLTDSQLVMTSLGPEGSVGQVLDVNSGIAEDMFVIANVKGGFVKLSPDGKRVAFSEQMFGEPAYGIYVSNLDGSEKRLVSSLNSGVTSGAWSPDSQWLALAVMDDASGVTREAVIVQPDTCRVIRLPKLTGSIIGWGDAP